MNKIWNASRFVIMNLDQNVEARHAVPLIDLGLSTPDKWIVTRLNRTIKEIENSLELYEFDKMARTIYQFIWGDFCDWYIELVKPILNGDDAEARKRTQAVLIKVLSSALQILSPISPFITEEIYQRLREFGFYLETPDGKEADSIVISVYPTFNQNEVYEEAYDEIEFVKEVIVAIRNLRAVVGIHPSSAVNVIIIPDDKTVLEKVKGNENYIISLAKASIDFSHEAKPKKAVVQVTEGLQVFLPIEGLIDVDKEVERIKRELSKIVKDIELSDKKLSNQDFMNRAPDEVVEKEKEKFEELSTKKQKMEEVLEKLSEIG